MKKKIVLRSILGFPFGLAIGYLISILISLIWASGYYSPCAPELIVTTGSEIHAVLIQALLIGILGSGFGAASVIWEIDDWGIFKQSGIYFLIILIIMMPIAYVLHWIKHSLKGVLSYFGVFLIIFIIIWTVQYVMAKHNVKKLNESLRKKQGDKNE